MATSITIWKQRNKSFGITAARIAANPELRCLLPSAAVKLKSLIPQPLASEPRTIGEHIKRRRLQVGLIQNAAGTNFGVSQFTVINWEYGLRKPAVKHWPAIVRFLGYDPSPDAAATLAERLIARRRELGWSQKTAALKLGVDPSTWSSWESGGTIMAKAHRRLIANFVGLAEPDIFTAMRKRWNDSHRRPTPR